MLPRDLAPASFRGVRFFCPKDSLEEGRQSIDHLFPDSNHRFAEDNGLIPPEFKISAILAGPNLRGQLKALRSALSRQGPGTLRHPWCGSQFVQVKGPYKIDREDTDAGVIKLEITFLVTGPPIFPGLVSGIPAVVSGLVGSAIDAIMAGFLSVYGGTGSTAASRSAVGGAISDIGATLIAAFGPSSAAEQLTSNGTRIADEPGRISDLLAASVRAPFGDKSVPTTALVSGFRDLADTSRVVSATAALIDPTTLDLDQRRAALEIIGATVEAVSFASLAEGLAATTFGAAEDVEAAETDMVTRFAAIQELPLDLDTHAALADVLTAISEVLAKTEVRLPRITVLENWQATPSSVLSYMLYASDDEQDRLIRLNAEMCPTLLHGSVSVVIGE